VLNKDNLVTISVNVSIVGSYKIYSDTINGYSFSVAGNFTNTGVQFVSLPATGKPLAIQIDTFKVTAGSSRCSFSVAVTAPVIVAQQTHFPLSYNSFWIYNDLLNPPDTLNRNVTDSILSNGHLYKIFTEQGRFEAPKEYFFRRDTNNYYEYGLVDKYTASYKFLPQIKGELNFLKENLTAGDSWKSDEYSGTATFGQLLFLQYTFFCEDANATVFVNGKTFTNVYKINVVPQIRSAITYPYNDTGEKIEFYYAKDIGVIYVKSSRNGFNITEFQIKSYRVI